MAVTDDQMRQYLADHVSSDLQFVWSDNDVSLQNQYNLAQHYKSLKVFATISDSKADLRAALRADFQLDVSTSPAVRAEVARIISAWEMSQELSQKEQQLRAESKVLGLPRTVQQSERQAMIKAVEAICGRLQESETPSNEYLALKVEECENNEPTACALDEVTSKFDTTTSALQSSLDASGHLRVLKTKTKGKMPENTESLRRSLKLEGVAWLCMSAKFRNKVWLHGLEMNTWLKYIDYVLGDKVYGLKLSIDGQTQAVRPPWTVLLTYEHRLRKEAFKLVAAGTHSLAEALDHVVKDSDIKECYFTTPIALGVGFTSQQSGEGKWRKMSGKGHSPGNQWFNNSFNRYSKGDGKGFKRQKGKGKGSKNSVLTRDENHNILVSKTPDGRELCFAFNSQGCHNKCGRVHACRVKGCLGNHSAREHHKYAKDAASGKDGGGTE